MSFPLFPMGKYNVTFPTSFLFGDSLYIISHLLSAMPRSGEHYERPPEIIISKSGSPHKEMIIAKMMNSPQRALRSASSPVLTPRRKSSATARATAGTGGSRSSRSGGGGALSARSGVSQGSPEWDSETARLLAAAGLQTRVKRVGGGYREVPYTAAELLEVAASLGDQLRATAAERDRALRERSHLADHAFESAQRHELVEQLRGQHASTLEQLRVQHESESAAHLTTIEELRVRLQELETQRVRNESSHYVEIHEHERILQEKAEVTAKLDELMTHQQAFARQWRAELEDLRFAHAEAEAELWCAHTAELTAATAELSAVEAESAALRQVASSALAAEFKARHLGSPTPTSARPASSCIAANDGSALRRTWASVASAALAAARATPTSAEPSVLTQAGFSAPTPPPKFDLTPRQLEKYTSSLTLPSAPNSSTAAFLKSRAEMSEVSKTVASNFRKSVPDPAASLLVSRREERRRRYQELKAMASTVLGT